MKKRTFIMGLAALALAFGSAGVIGGVSLSANDSAIMTRAEETAAYTLSFTKNSSNSAYANTFTITSNDIKWSVPGNQGLGNYVKIGGKFSTGTRVIYSLGKIDKNIDSIVINSSSKDDQITVVKIAAKGYSTASGAKSGGETDLVFEKTVTTYASEMCFDDIVGGSGLYYRFEFALTSTSSSSNKGVVIDSIEFFEAPVVVTGISISPSDDAILPVGSSKTFDLNFEGSGLTGNEEATLSFSEDVEGLTLSTDKVKNGGSFVVTATAAGAIAELSATYGDITSNKVTIMTEAAKVPESLAFSGELTKSTYFVGETFDPTGLTAVVTFTDKTTKDVTDSLTWSLGAIAADTTSVTATYSESGVTVSASVEVSVRKLSSITVDTNPNLTYEEGDALDLTGMVVTKHYDDGYTTTCTDYTTTPVAGTVLAQSNTSLVISVDGAESVTLPLTVNEYIGKEYEIVTSDSEDLSGTYLIVYKASSSATTGMSFNCEDATNGYNSVSISGTKITDCEKAVDKDTVTLSKVDGGYSIKVNGGTNAGKYISGTSGSNKLNFGSSASAVSVSFNEDGSAHIVSNTSVLRFNSASDNMRFRFFKSSGYSSQKEVYLYKQLDTAAINEATTWAQSFLDGTATSCADYNADNYDKLSADSVWAALKTSYETLSENAKKIIKAQTADGSSTNALEQAVARYDHIVNRYASLTDFLGRRTATSTVKSAFFGNNSNDGTNLAIVITCAVAAAALSTTFILRKKKQDC